MKPFLQLKPVSDVEKIIFDLPMLPEESVPLELAFGRRLARPFYAPEDLPGFRRSSMDGYAVASRDVFGAGEGSPALLRLGPPCRMGQMPDFCLGEGEAAPIATGAPLPEGADAVVMIEHTRPADQGQIEIIRPVAPGDHLVERDEDASRGMELIAAGRLLRAQETGILAAFGVTEVRVVRQARVAVISTGDELVAIDAKPKPGQIRDVNSWSLAALCRSAGALASPWGIVNDEPGALAGTLAKAREAADVIVVSGGSSQGMRDHTVEAFSGLPDAVIFVHGVAISPGKPFILGRSGSVCLVGLPGHVSGALVCGHVLLAPLLRHLQGLPRPEPQAWLEAVLSRSIASSQGRRDYIRCRLIQTDTGLSAEPLSGPSAVLRGLIDADGLIVCPENSEGLSQGQKVRVYPV